jgi:sortase A
MVANPKTKKSLRYLEAGLLAVGLTLLAIYGAIRIYSGASSEAALREFASAGSVVENPAVPDGPPAKERVDFSLWSDKRVAAYRESLGLKPERPPAVLSIPSLRLEVPVYDGTDELILNRGVGRVLGTAKLGQPGNIGIAGHRDGFFRCLKDVHVGDRIELVTPGRKTAYEVESIDIVSPDDVSVLQPRERPSLTLITCYPFYFIGDAPQRYIVKASIAEQGASAGDRPKSETGEIKGQKNAK